MSKKELKPLPFVGEITEEWAKATYPKANAHDIRNVQQRLNGFFEFIGLTDAEFVEGFKRAKDRLEWAKQNGSKVVAFYNERLKQGKSVNTARSETSTIRAFSRDNATVLIVQRRRIAKAKAALGEHELNQRELAKMFSIANVRDKAILSTAVSLGFSVEDFAELKRDFIEALVNKSLEEKLDFVPFTYERGKTGVESRSHLTPEAVQSLKAWFEYSDKKRAAKGLPKSEYVWSNGNGDRLNVQTLNDVVKTLAKEANIAVTGQIRFHLLRKFLMNSLHDAGLSDWEVKRVIGKEIGTSDSTYLQGLNRTVTEKFPQVYSHIRLVGFERANGTRIEDLETKMQQLEIKMESMSLENATLKRIIDFAIPPEVIKHALIETARRLPNMTPEKLEQLENSLKMARNEEEIEEGLRNIMVLVKRKTEKDQQ